MILLSSSTYQSAQESEERQVILHGSSKNETLAEIQLPGDESKSEMLLLTG